MKEVIIGIDLGTTNSLAASVFEEGPEVLLSETNSAIVPSVLSYIEGKWVVGEEALPYRSTHAQNTVYSVKRLMGRNWKELGDETQELPYSVVAAEREQLRICIGEKLYSPQELSAEILKAVKLQAEQHLGHPVRKIVITVPAYFDDAQRQATRDAARIAGMEVVRILNEPTAAAIAYGLDQAKDELVVVYDFGGGTFDVSVLKLSGKIFKVIATHGDTHLGGDDLDNVLMKELIKRIHAEYADVELNTPALKHILKKTAESLKTRLSSTLETEYSLRIDFEHTHSGIFHRETLNTLIEPIVQQTLQHCEHALAQADLSKEDIDEVVLVGGSTLVPGVREQVTQFFGRAPHVAIDPYKVVALGAGIQGHLLAGGRRDFLLLDVVPLALGIETLGGTFSKLITANTTLPSESMELFTTHVDNQTSIDINIYQGERELVKHCRRLGQFKLRGIPAMKAGLAVVEVKLKVDTNGLLKVSAKEQRSNTQAEIEVIPFHGLSQNEIETIMEDSFDHAQEDFNSRQLIEFRQMTDRVFQGIETQWEVAKKTLSEAQRQNIRAQMKVVADASKKQNAGALKVEMDKLGELTRPLADRAIGKSVLSAISTELNT